MGEITIKNLKNEKPKEPWQIKVDRSSVLGNPFVMTSESERDKVCNQYQEHFDFTLEVAADEIESQRIEVCKFINELYRLKTIYEKYGKLELFCWCAPKRCHAETIKNYLEVHNELQ